MANEGILLESGTNEVEILEFTIADQNFGVNVLKIQAIEQHDPARVTHIELAHPSIVGTLLFRDSCITLVDLGKEMASELAAESAADEAVTAGVGAPDPAGAEAPTKLVLVMEFNDLKTAFLVDGVSRIYRVSWEDIKPLSAYLNTTDSKFTGSMQIDSREVLIVDMEKIVAEIMPQELSQFSVQTDESNPHFTARSTKTVFLAEDSAIIRQKVVAELGKGNYTNVKVFPNGRDCLDEIQRLTSTGANITDHVNVLVSDIEMPAMDGLALCRTLKNGQATKDLPVIMFSSLINEQIAHKCDEVGADAYISKPQFTELINLLDRFSMSDEAVPA